MSQSEVTLTLIAPSREAWEVQNQTDTEIFGIPLDYDVLDFRDGQRRPETGCCDIIVFGPEALLQQIATAARADGWTATLGGTLE